MRKIYYFISVESEHHKYSAALNRVQSIKRGFDTNNIISEIVLTHKKTFKSRVYTKLNALLYTLLKLLKTNRGDTIIFYGMLPYYILIPIFKYKRLKFIIELNEYPHFLIKQGGVSGKQMRKQKYRLSKLSRFDGLITCSNALLTYYSQYLKLGAKVLIVPLVVDVERFSSKKPVKNNLGSYFAYCGRLGNNKDGVPILIDAFTSFASEVNSIKLYIIGNASDDVERELKGKVAKLSMQNKIIFTGAMSQEDLIPILQNSELLLLARPDNKQAEGGIPSKVGEYMSVKVPMVVTKVGELDKFLTDSVNCFMAEPDSVKSFKDKMLEAYYSSDKAKIVKNAFETVKQFDIKKQSASIYEFIMQL